MDDDSISDSSDDCEDRVRDFWREIDFERRGVVPRVRIAEWFETKFGIAKEKTIGLISEDIDRDRNGTITFKEFDKFVKKTIGT